MGDCGFNFALLLLDSKSCRFSVDVFIGSLGRLFFFLTFLSDLLWAGCVAFGGYFEWGLLLLLLHRIFLGICCLLGSDHLKEEEGAYIVRGGGCCISIFIFSFLFCFL
jgi:hypothetical protein